MGNLNVTESMKQNLLTATKWLSFLNILGAIGLGGCLVFSITILFLPTFGGTMRFIYAAIYLVAVALYCYPLKKSFELARKTKEAMNNDAQEALEASVACYKSILKFYGVFAIVSLALYTVAGVATLILLVAFR